MRHALLLLAGVVALCGSGTVHAGNQSATPGFYNAGVFYPMDPVYDQVLIRGGVKADPGVLGASMVVGLKAVEDLPRHHAAVLHLAASLDEDRYRTLISDLSLMPGVQFAGAVYRRGRVVRLADMGEVIVTFSPGTTGAFRNNVSKRFGMTPVERFSFAPEIVAYRLAGGSPPTWQVAMQLQALAGVREAQPDFLHTVARKHLPQDPLVPRQWHVRNTDDFTAGLANDINLTVAFDITRGDSSVVIALLDDGFDLGHEDLSMGFLAGMDFLDHDSDPSAGVFGHHGTPVAGLAGARADNDLGGVGVCPGCSLLPVRLVGEDQSARDEANAIAWSVTQGAAIINNSWGVPDGNLVTVPIPHVVAAAIDYAMDQGRGGLGSLVLFAAGNGNEPIDLDGYAAYPHALAIGASTDQGLRALYSDFGPELAFNAPSSGGYRRVVTTDRSDSEGYADSNYCESFGGTSAACPLAAGVMGLILSARPDLSWRQVLDIARATARRLDVDNGNYDSRGHSSLYGFGRLDAGAALAAARDFNDGCRAVPETCDGLDNDCDGSVDEGRVCRACVAMAETCNGIDDDCDIMVDEDGVCLDVGGSACMACNSDEQCASGLCKAVGEAFYQKVCLETCDSERKCVSGFVCTDGRCLPLGGDCPHALCAMQQERCNGVDDNCNDLVDETAACCTPGDPPEETCDGVDNDCDGVVDNVSAADIPEIEGCAGAGICRDATVACVAGRWLCRKPNGYEPVETLCDGLDNDCDGFTDEPDNLWLPPGFCRTVGVCAYATPTCERGVWVCHYPDGYEQVETSCDDLDNDCDSVVDAHCQTGGDADRDNDISSLHDGGCGVASGWSGVLASLLVVIGFLGRRKRWGRNVAKDVADS